jgi:hypothetical protein
VLLLFILAVVSIAYITSRITKKIFSAKWSPATTLVLMVVADMLIKHSNFAALLRRHLK